MSRYNDIYKRFTEEFPKFQPQVKSWKKQGRNSIMLYLTNGRRLIFRIVGTETKLSQV